MKFINIVLFSIALSHSGFNVVALPLALAPSGPVTLDRRSHSPQDTRPLLFARTDDLPAHLQRLAKDIQRTKGRHQAAHQQTLTHKAEAYAANQRYDSVKATPLHPDHKAAKSELIQAKKNYENSVSKSNGIGQHYDNLKAQYEQGLADHQAAKDAPRGLEPSGHEDHGVRGRESHHS